ncbi:SOS response-associated peptidase [Mucilaginibacter flavidus]|uniref:SOS response-associated peptidase n=1 Tax=Mucilaginibacter flavidus TaxID=2949309 RepID=UPI002093ACDC|nr:SOS response-associated peptidase [Mucilaginibacter flavidus]MCO5950501.1 SOS response-associated peptidase [Mucilaginibacter flavidus]
MCYHVQVSGNPDAYEKRFGRKFHPHFIDKMKKLYHANGFAHPDLPIITQENPEEIELAQWALVPHFAFNDTDAKKYRVGNLNSKCETIFELKSFKKPILERRCLVLADGFFESMDYNDVAYPFFIYPKDREPFAFAGIYSYWKRENGDVLKTLSIVTTTAAPNHLMTKIHNKKLRMPVILPREIENMWLKKDLLPEELKALMLPLENGILTAHPVSNDVNKSKVHSNHEYITDVFEYPELAGEDWIKKLLAA